MKNEIRFTLESKQRPKLAQEIGNLLGTAPHYERVPSCVYDIAGYRLDKEGVLHIPEGAEETAKDLILQLRERGFQDDAEITEEVPVQQDKLTIVIPRESLTDMALENLQRKFLKFVYDDVVYCKYYEVVYILFHTGMRISEFCGLTLKDIDLENRTVNIDHQLQRTSDMRYIIETTKTDAGTRVLPITEDVAQMFQAIIEDRNAPKVEKAIDGYSGFLFYDDNGMPLVAMHWQHRFNHMVGRYNDIYRVQMPNITPHVCRHTYCSNMAKSGMNPKTLQYLMGHSDISVTMNVYTHIGFDDAEEELKRMEEFRKVQAEVEQKKEKPMSQKMFKVI